MKKALLATVMAFLVSSVANADELRLEASASAELGGNTVSVEEQTRHDLSISGDMVTKAAAYQHTVVAVSRDLSDNIGLALRVRNTSTNGTSENRLSLDMNAKAGLPLGIGLTNRLRFQIDENSDITAITADDLRLREEVRLTKTVNLSFVSLDVSVGDEVHISSEGKIKENRISAAVANEVCPGLTARAEYFRQQMTDADDANVVFVSAALRF
jgi:hypothetical protein